MLNFDGDGCGDGDLTCKQAFRCLRGYDFLPGRYSHVCHEVTIVDSVIVVGVSRLYCARTTSLGTSWLAGTTRRCTTSTHAPVTSSQRSATTNNPFSAWWSTMTTSSPPARIKPSLCSTDVPTKYQKHCRFVMARLHVPSMSPFL